VNAWVPAVTLALLIGGCGASEPPTEETTALRLCSDELRKRLDIPKDEHSSQTQMIGKRDYGWLVRGLSREVPGAVAQNYECRLDDPASGRPTLTYLRLCEAGESPWGCPTTPAP
jgi:hypothetical protein